MSGATGQAVHCGQHALAAGKLKSHGAGALAECRERLAGAEHLPERRLAGRKRRMGGGDVRVGPDQQQATARVAAAFRHECLEV